MTPIPSCGFANANEKMSIPAISQYRGGAIDDVISLAARMRAMLLNHGVDYRLGRVEAGPNADDWLTIVRYPDRATYGKAQVSFAQDPDYQQTVTEIEKFATRISRELVIDLDL
jgi:hypothetical protein